jgi:hypothetical protein
MLVPPSSLDTDCATNRSPDRHAGLRPAATPVTIPTEGVNRIIKSRIWSASGAPVPARATYTWVVPKEVTETGCGESETLRKGCRRRQGANSCFRAKATKALVIVNQLVEEVL